MVEKKKNILIITKVYRCKTLHSHTWAPMRDTHYESENKFPINILQLLSCNSAQLFYQQLNPAQLDQKT